MLTNLLFLTTLSQTRANLLGQPRPAEKFTAAADNFGWFGGAPILFRRRRRIPFSTGGGG